MARVLRFSIRENVDSAFRYGGDEFVVILPEADTSTAQAIGHRIQMSFKDTESAGVTLSMGVAEFQKDFDMVAFVHLGNGIGRFAGSVVYYQPLSDSNQLVGVQFTKISDTGSRLLTRFLDSHSTQRTSKRVAK